MGAGASVDEGTVQRVEAAFKNADKAGKGKLNFKDLILAIKTSGMNRNNSAVAAKEFINSADENSDGAVSLDEFKAFFQKTLLEVGPEESQKLLDYFEQPSPGGGGSGSGGDGKPTPAPVVLGTIDDEMLQRVEVAFKRADVNGSKSVTYKELMSAIAHTGLGRMNCAAQAKDFMSQADTNHDGSLSLEEFKKFFATTCAEAGYEEASHVLTAFEWRAETSALQRNAANSWEPPASLSASEVSRARSCFASLDANKDAGLTARELGRALTTVGLSRAEAAKEGRRLMAAMDTDCDREVNLVEFGAYLAETKGASGGDAKVEALLTYFEKMGAAPKALAQAALDDSTGTASMPLSAASSSSSSSSAPTAGSLSAAQACAAAQKACAARGTPAAAAVEAALLALKAGVSSSSSSSSSSGGWDAGAGWAAGTPYSGWAGVKVKEGAPDVVEAVDMGQAEGAYKVDDVLALLTPALRSFKAPQMAAEGSLDAFAACAELRELHATGGALTGNVGALGHGCPQLARLKVREAPRLGGDAGDLVGCLRLNTLWLEGSGVVCACGEGALKQELPKCDISLSAN